MRFALAEDQESARDYFRGILTEIMSGQYPDVAYTLDTFPTGELLLAEWTPEKYGTIFLDCCLEGGADGLEIAKKLRERDVAVHLVFVTSSADYAVGGYQVRASGYLLKPYDSNELSAVLRNLNLSDLVQSRCLTGNSNREQWRVAFEDILYCDVEGHYTCVHTIHGEHRIREPFRKTSDELLSDRRFLSCYQGCIINLERVSCMDKQNFILENEVHIPLRRRDASALRQRYQDWLFENSREKGQPKQVLPSDAIRSEE